MRLMNEIIAATFTGITSCIRHDGVSAPGLSYGMRSLREIATLLVPKPSMKFIAPSLFPLFSKRIQEERLYSSEAIYRNLVWQRRGLLVEERLSDSIINGALLFQGSVSPRELRLIHRSVHLEKALKYNPVFHSELKVFLSQNTAPCLPECFSLRAEKCQAVGLFNSTLMREFFKKLDSRFEEMEAKH